MSKKELLNELLSIVENVCKDGNVLFLDLGVSSMGVFPL